MKKRVMVFLLITVMLMVIPVHAASRAATFMPSLSFEGTTARCGVTILGATNDEIEVTLSLWCGNSLIDSWYSEGTGYLRMSKATTVTRGYTYRLESNVTINGIELDDLPITKKCE